MNRFFKSIDKIITEVPVSGIMTRKVLTLKETDNVQKAIDLLSEHSISGAIITRSEKPVGMISEGDLLKKVFHKKLDPKTVKLSDIMKEGIYSLPPTKSIGEVAAFMKKHEISKLPLMENDQIVGYVTKSDLLEKLNEIYYQNRQLIWLTVIVTVQFIIIAILITALIGRG
ncbi:MAG: CBS domain-containing protein [Candidatus Woesearchaeota archaeon]|nr:CBS domain-containing protein [Candidatus Woesearchaeota archaeon]